MENKMNGVAKTSLLVAAMRANETNRNDGVKKLFSDPYAETLAGPLGFSIMKKAIEVVGDQPAIAVRTAYFDEKFNKALALGYNQIVIVAAGMDSRAYRLQFPENCMLFELDQPEVLEYKSEKLKDATPNCTRVAIATDLTTEWQKELIEAGFDRTKKTLWSVEGLLMYLEEAQVVKLIERINSLSKKDDLMLFDIFTKRLLEAPHMLAQISFLKEIGTTWQFGTNDPEGFMKNLGWAVEMIQPGTFLPERWPYPVAPLEIPDVPRSFFVQATKI